MIRLFFALCGGLLLLSTTHGAVQEFDSGTLKVESSGQFTIKGISAGIFYFDPSWKSTSQTVLQTDAGFPRSTPTSWDMQGSFQPQTGEPAFMLREKIERLDAGTYRISYRVEGKDKDVG